MPAIILPDRVPRVIDMQKARGPDRRKWNSRRGWGLRLPEGFVERRRQVERRMPAVAEGSLAEFEELKQAVARRSKRKREAKARELDSAAARAPGIDGHSLLPWDFDDKE